MNIDHKIIQVPKREIWVSDKEEFLSFDEVELELEHSLFSLSLWESKYHKPFMSSDKTPEEMADYIRMMCVRKEQRKSLSLDFFLTLPQEIYTEISNYIDDPMTATTFSQEEDKKGVSNKKEIITAEIIYYWMTTQNIPFDCEMWHINKLITLVKVCGIKNQPEDNKKKKMTSSDLALRRARMEAARAKYNKH